MAKLNGRYMRMIVGGLTLAGCKSFTLNVDVDNPDATTKDDDAWGSSIYGSKKWNVSYEALYDPSGTFSVEEIYDILDNDTEVILEMAVIDGVGGGLVLHGAANSGGFSLTAENNAPISLSGTFNNVGKLYKGTVAAS